MDPRKRWTQVLWRPMTVLALVAGFAAPLAPIGDTAAQETLPATAAVPESTVLFHSMDLDRDGEQWQQAASLLARVGVPDALDLWEDAILEEAERSGDFTQADFDALLGGELAIAVLPVAVEHFAAMAMQGLESDTMFREGDATPASGTGAEQIGIVGILNPGNPDAAWAYVERQVSDLAAEQNVTVEEATYGEAVVLVVPPGEASDHSGMDADAGMHGMDDWMGGHAMDGFDGFVTAYAGDFIVAGATETDVEAVIDVIDGAAGSLADAPQAQAVAAELPAETLSFTYLDSQGILDVLDPEAIAMLQSFMPDVPVEAWGGQSGIAISADDPGFRFDSVTVLDETADLASVIVENDPAVAATAERAPAGTFAFQAGRLAENAFQRLPYLLAHAVNAGESGEWADEQPMMEFPTEEEMDAEIAKAATTLEFDPRTDLFDLLGDEFLAFTSFPSFDFENFGIDAVAAIATTDPDALAETAQKVAAFIDRSEPNTDVTVRKAGAETVYVVTDTDNPAIPGLEFGVVADQAVIGIGRGIEDLVSDPTDSLADDAQFQTVMGFLPAEYYQIGYLDIGQAIDPIVMLIGMTGMMDGAGSVDADLACADYENQAQAQEAYDADAAANANLDLDGDGQACEDAFGMASGTPMATSGDPRNIRALGAVAFQQDNVMGASAILYIAEP